MGSRAGSSPVARTISSVHNESDEHSIFFCLSSAYTIKKLFCETNKDWNAINSARAKYAHLADVYTSTDWKRIKLETVGKGSRNDKFLPKWTEIFETNESYFSNQNKVNVDIFIEGNDNKKE